ncbi:MULTISPECIES: sulfite exporter TauE/SafE family protein [Vibrio]|uniref:Sulfite exporter TauE/SafE family protein n=1 Tax=Vibrio casei TaxID=673372 RepID=A0A368LN69_9VIBR|nr:MULTISPECIES: sulfite exporter TauE/SafE family protein [Vibrio]RCS73251.1 sulfite exporter TauE/SafE family protein [Vibrio casei]SJN18531.1 Heavy-metal-associated domain (N-terminus) and membrane-bounded cytochrome biogenesis cycZ-like domain, possible membrane copper tolerance protein [Vibrio casei]HBV75715.1 sulfite exporter TauE/SafE family protein [Vibrio sp.]
MTNDWFAAFLIGLLGAGHCMGMCGGIASLMNIGEMSSKRLWLNPILYNVGRIISYTLIGGIVGSTISTIAEYSGVNAPLNWLRLISSIFMIILALYIGQWWAGLLYIEKTGQHIWKYISPLGKKLLPIKHPFYAIPFGFIWGWLPCGLVYSMLTWSAASGGAPQGALIMFSFGLGTLPLMLSIGLSTTKLNQWIKSILFRRIGATLLLFYALFQLYQGVVRLM